jgi:hypothetical protein
MVLLISGRRFSRRTPPVDLAEHMRCLLRSSRIKVGPKSVENAGAKLLDETQGAALARTRLAMPALDSGPLAAPAPGVSPPAGEWRTDRRAAKAFWILELHRVHHCPGFACFMPRFETLWGSV